MAKKGDPVLVRTYSAGIHFGRLVSRSGKEVSLSDARRIWYWKGANTLHEISLHGVSVGSKISEPVGTIELTEAIEILPLTKDAVLSLSKIGWEK